MKFWLIAILAPGVMAIGESVWEQPSVWDQAETKQHGKVVLIKGIAVDGDSVTVTVVSADKDSDSQFRETVKLCSQNSGGFVTAGDLAKSDLIQQAFNEGKSIQVQFSGSFNRCISKVSSSASESQDTVKSI